MTMTKSYSAVLMLGLLFQGCSQIQFIKQPQDVCVAEGGEGFFPCTYVGTLAVPRWKINNNVYSASTIPARHFYNGTGLLVARVSLSMNMFRYTCILDVGTQLLSNTACLLVVSSNSTCSHTSITSAIMATSTTRLSIRLSWPSPTNAGARTYKDISRRVTLSSRSTVIMKTQNETVIDESTTTYTEMNAKYAYIIFCVIGLIIPTLLVGLLLIKKCKRKQVNSNTTVPEPLYEQILDNASAPKSDQVPTEMNICYEMPLNQCAAYSAANIRSQI